MHSGPLAFESATYASVMSMVFGSLLLIMYRGGVRIPGMRLLISSWYMACIYFFILAVSAGSGAWLTRGEIALFERIWLIATFTCFAASYVLIFRSFASTRNIHDWLW